MLKTGLKNTLERTVTREMTAKQMGSGKLEVFATPALIALAEETAWKSVEDILEDGQGTVGTKMDLSHIAATPVGMRVRCESELVDVDRRKLIFSINVFDEREKIAEGTHERFIIDNKAFFEKASTK